MGWSSSWIAIQGRPKDDILGFLKLVETGEDVYPGSRSTDFSVKEFPGDWVVLFSESFDWANPARTLELSKLGLVIACQFEDKVAMTSTARAARDGMELWRVFHDHEQSVYRLDISGEPPAGLAAIRDQHFRQQESDGGEDAGVDYVHDVPFELARTVCGYRHDEDDSLFLGLRPDRAEYSSDRSSRPSLFNRLFGRRPDR